MNRLTAVRSTVDPGGDVTSPRGVPLAALRNVSYAFPGQPKLFHGFSCQVCEGTITAVYGANGCGKSTLGLIMLGILQPHEGERWTHPKLGATGSITSVYQDVGTSLLPWLSALENVAFALQLGGCSRRDSLERGADALARWAPSVKRHALPGNLSGGQRQLVAWARSLVVDPSLVILDEPFSALDRAHVAALSEELCRRVSDLGASALFITHELDHLLLLADEVLLLRSGTNSAVRCFRVTLPRPRDLAMLANEEAVALRRQILEVTWKGA